MGLSGYRPRGGRGSRAACRAGAWRCAALGLGVALALWGCATGETDGAGARPIGTAIEAKSTVRAMTQAAVAALERLTVDGTLDQVTVSGLAGSATVAGRVIHTQSTTGFSTTDALDADVTILFAEFRTDLPDGGSATLSGTLDLLLGTGSPGTSAGPDPFPGQKPVEVNGDLAATWRGTGLTGIATDSFSFAATGPTVDGLSGTLTTLGGEVFQY